MKNFRFVNEYEFEKLLEEGLRQIPERLENLRNHGFTESTKIRLRFSFDTNTEKKASCLATELIALNYQEVKILGYWEYCREHYYTITARTQRPEMTDKSILDWAKKMYFLANSYDCIFSSFDALP